MSFVPDPLKYPWFTKHLSAPASLIFYEHDDGTVSVKLAHSWDDLEVRVDRYVKKWNRDFPDHPIKMLRIESVNFTGVVR